MLRSRHVELFHLAAGQKHSYSIDVGRVALFYMLGSESIVPTTFCQLAAVQCHGEVSTSTDTLSAGNCEEEAFFVKEPLFEKFWDERGLTAKNNAIMVILWVSV